MSHRSEKFIVAGKAATIADPTMGASSSTVLHEVATMARQDRVYAVALSSDGRYIAVGGRDKVRGLSVTNRLPW